MTHNIKEIDSKTVKFDIGLIADPINSNILGVLGTKWSSHNQ